MPENETKIDSLTELLKDTNFKKLREGLTTIAKGMGHASDIEENASLSAQIKDSDQTRTWKYRARITTEEKPDYSFTFIVGGQLPLQAEKVVEQLDAFKEYLIKYGLDPSFKGSLRLLAAGFSVKLSQRYEANEKQVKNA
jgi:hypothetical protein